MRHGWSTLALPHRTWFFFIFVASFAFMIAIPPFQTNDEPAHWDRTWTVARGQLVCGEIPVVVVDDTLAAARYDPVRFGKMKFSSEAWDAMRRLPGVNDLALTQGGACAYIPVAYVLPAISMLPFVSPLDPTNGAGMLAGFYAARTSNWILMGLAVFVFLLIAPGFRNLTLVIYSFPTVIQQTVSINQESFTFLCVFALIWLWARRPTQRTVLWMLVVITLLSAIKITFLALLVLWIATVVRWVRAEAIPLRRTLWVSALIVLPLLIQLRWWTSGAATLYSYPGVDPGLQMKYLLEHPLRIFGLLGQGHLDLAGRGYLNGGWTGLFGVLGWSEYGINRFAYLLLFLSLLLALLLDAITGHTVDEPDGKWLVRSRWTLPVLSAYAMVPLIMLSLYLGFTAVGDRHIIGVQGRYLLFPYFFMLTFGADWFRWRWPDWKLPGKTSGCLRWTAFGMCALAVVSAFGTVLQIYH